ncbi:conserved hypothetical protein [Shewanella halifaxensis HAW-EB4]|uniref:Uncharacterized protein n=1 Tax=Shewanella halifaxensis (strain HAW-EB4) TaxID=458817 RepID=B0TKZ8_SHEHH|nr:DUF6624 domain-containing protein [Shewanella halifaxensis]ABZ77200.1 conserved hypothetical protein [Shewanella halifaxensis HAW-EB4]
MRCLLVLLFFSFSAFAEMNLELQKELIEMGVKDQKIREEIAKVGWNNSPQYLLDKLKAIDAINTKKLKAIIEEHSWPTKDLVGVKGVNAGFLIIQHSPDIDFKVAMLPKLKKAYSNDQGVTGQKLALLTDNVLVSQGKNQLYGTQAEHVNGAIIIKPIDDEANVDKRRADLKMPPLEFYIKFMEEAYGLKDHPEIELN